MRDAHLDEIGGQKEELGWSSSKNLVEAAILEMNSGKKNENKGTTRTLAQQKRTDDTSPHVFLINCQLPLPNRPFRQQTRLSRLH